MTSRATDTLTVTRSYGGDAAQSFDADDYIYLNVTEGVLDQITTAINALENGAIQNDGSIVTDNNVAQGWRNAADSADIDCFKVDASDILQILTLPRLPAARSISHNNDVVDKLYGDTNWSGNSVATKSEAAAGNGEVFENTYDGNRLNFKDSGSTVHDIMLRQDVSMQAGSGSAAVDVGGTTSANIDIAVGPLSSTDKVFYMAFIELDISANPNPGTVTYNDRVGMMSGEPAGEEAEVSFGSAASHTTASDQFEDGSINVPSATGSISATATATGPNTGTITVTAPTWSGNNLRFAVSISGSEVASGIVAGNARVSVFAVRLTD